MSNGVFNFNFLALVFSEILRGSQIYAREPYAPWAPVPEKFFLSKASTSQYLIVFLITNSSSSSFRDFRGSQIYVRGPCAPCTPPSGKNFAPEAITLLCVMAFLISTF